MTAPKPRIYLHRNYWRVSHAPKPWRIEYVNAWHAAHLFVQSRNCLPVPPEPRSPRLTYARGWWACTCLCGGSHQCGSKGTAYGKWLRYARTAGICAACRRVQDGKIAADWPLFLAFTSERRA